MSRPDLVVIGAGIVGLATAYQYTRQYPQKRVWVLEKEGDMALHQTGRNSGVIHSGIYYKPGSLKALNCRAGKEALIAFCEAEGIAYDICGKTIVAVSEKELPTLNMLFERGQQNGVDIELIDRARLMELEPHTAGIRAIHVKEAGIVDYVGFCRRLGEIIQSAGDNQIRYNTRVLGFQKDGTWVRVLTDKGEIETDLAVNCAGLYSDHLVASGGQRPDVRIVPFRGEYFELRESARQLCNNLIYPVPDPAFPFLGVHFTRMINQSVECGPNAVLAFGRESYSKYQVNLGETAEIFAYGGFRKLAAKHWRTGFGEMWRSFSKAAFVKALQRLVPAIQASDLEAAPAGIRAQAITEEGNLVDDFQFREVPGVVHVCNVPSPAATASLNIGLEIMKRLP
ncbi:MAG TPA: L-2-hydroxyglutarate oxidase [Calditrichia bacterium]|nr:L-2-hydroxyglutarate oxidase [Calditrichia bacterium]